MKTVKQRVEKHATYLANGVLLCVEAWVPTKKSSNRYDAKSVGFHDYAAARLYLKANGRSDDITLCQIDSDDEADDTQILIGDVLMQLGDDLSSTRNTVVAIVRAALQSVLNNPEE